MKNLKWMVDIRKRAYAWYDKFKQCKLCLEEKFNINFTNPINNLNKGSELISKCWHIINIFVIWNPIKSHDL